MKSNKIDIKNLIKIVRQDGSVRTGVDVYNPQGRLLLEQNILFNQEKVLKAVLKIIGNPRIMDLRLCIR